jgi:hypothetical protein
MRGVPIVVLVCVLCAMAQVPQGVRNESQKNAGSEQVRVELKNVNYHFTDRIAAGIYQLNGRVVPTKPEGMPVFDDKNSFFLDVSYAEISVSTDALSNVMNQYVFAAEDAPLKAITVSTDGTSLKIKGKLRSKDGAPFESDGTLSATSEGEIRVQTRKIKAGGLPVKGLMDLLGLKIADLINTRKVAGVRIQGDDLYLTPEQIFPPPHIRGRVTDVRIEGNQIVQIFGKKPPDTPQFNGNYMAYRGGQLRFGKLTMSDTDMVLIDMDPQDPFDFYLDHYKDQLVAGYTKTTPEFGLRVYMRDFNKLGRPAISGRGRRKRAVPQR